MTRIRPERPGEDAAIAAVLSSAFGGDVETRLVARLRETQETALALVAEADEEIVGHIAFARAVVDSGTGQIAIAWLAPLAVAPHRHGRGIGSALVTAGLDGCHSLGFKHTIVLGEPGYYRRFGYSLELAGTLASHWPREALMAARLAKDAPDLGGTLIDPAAFAVLR